MNNNTHINNTRTIMHADDNHINRPTNNADHDKLLWTISVSLTLQIHM